jgi:hypothetical protein
MLARATERLFCALWGVLTALTVNQSLRILDSILGSNSMYKGEVAIYR